MLCCLSASHIVVPGWEDEDVLIVGYTEEPPRKRRKVADEGVCLETQHRVLLVVFYTADGICTATKSMNKSSETLQF